MYKEQAASSMLCEHSYLFVLLFVDLKNWEGQMLAFGVRILYRKHAQSHKVCAASFASTITFFLLLNRCFQIWILIGGSRLLLVFGSFERLSTRRAQRALRALLPFFQLERAVFCILKTERGSHLLLVLGSCTEACAMASIAGSNHCKHHFSCIKQCFLEFEDREGGTPSLTYWRCVTLDFVLLEKWHFSAISWQ